VSFPIEVRFAAADDIPLSTASGRESAYLAVHMFRGQPYQRYFDEVEAVMGALEGRPHWGKMHSLDAATLRARYPRFDEFLAVRKRVDPDGRVRQRLSGPRIGAGGMSTIHDLVTPALLVEAGALEANLATMAAARPGDRLRPHVKAHKCTALAARQRAVGHPGFTCAHNPRGGGMVAAGLGVTYCWPTRCWTPAGWAR